MGIKGGVIKSVSVVVGLVETWGRKDWGVELGDLPH